MKKVLSLVMAFVIAMSMMLTMGGCGASEAKLTGSYDYSDSYIWFDEYQKNLIGVKKQHLELFDNGSYILSMEYQCIANMDVEIVSGAKYDPFYSSRLTLTGNYETVSPADEFGSMEIKLNTAEIYSVNGNFDTVWPCEVDGVQNFTVTAAGATVSIDTSAFTIESEIPMFALKG